MHIGPVVVSGPVEVLVSVLVVDEVSVASGPVEVVVSGPVVVVSRPVVVVVDVGSSVGSTGVVVLMLALSLPVPSGPAVVGKTAVVEGAVEVEVSPVVVEVEVGSPTLTRPLPSKLQATSRVNAVQRARTTK